MHTGLWVALGFLGDRRGELCLNVSRSSAAASLGAPAIHAAEHERAGRAGSAGQRDRLYRWPGSEETSQRLRPYRSGGSQMIDRNHIFEIEFIKKAVLPTYRLTHHRPDPLAPFSPARNHDRPSPSKDFFNTLGYKQTLRPRRRYV